MTSAAARAQRRCAAARSWARGALTCYKNGVSALTTTDTTYTSASPDSFCSAPYLLQELSGGNLHPLAQLDVEQDWAKTQHFTQGVHSTARRLAQARVANKMSSARGADVHVDRRDLDAGQAVTITRLQVQAKNRASGCTTNAIVRLTMATTPVNLTIGSAANDSGPIAQNYAAGTSLTVAVQTAAAGCATSPAGRQRRRAVPACSSLSSAAYAGGR